MFPHMGIGRHYFYISKPMGVGDKMREVGNTHWVGNIIVLLTVVVLQLFRVSLRQWYLRRERGQVAGGVQLRTAEPAPGSCL
jgi:hypothetical protein